MCFQLVVMFVDSFVDDVTYVRDVEVCRVRYKEYPLDILVMDMV